ncbi:MAG: GNAT family N-acetyltransferase [Parvibaculaceae bacterium]
MNREIETDRLILHPPRSEDAAEIARLVGNRKVAFMLARVPWPYTEDDARSFLSSRDGRPDGEIVFALYRKSDPERLIGVCGYDPVSHGKPDLGYWLGEPYWGQGYMSEAAAAVRDHAFTQSGHTLLYSGCHITNIASRRVLEKIGFKRVGLGHIFSRARGANVPVDRFAMTRERWEGLRS